jgi:hypothetical protein
VEWVVLEHCAVPADADANFITHPNDHPNSNHNAHRQSDEHAYRHLDIDANTD